MKKTKKLLFLIIAITFLSLYINLPNQIKLDFSLFGKVVNYQFNISHPTFSLAGLEIPTYYPLRRGLDLAGGSHLVFQAETKDFSVEEREKAAESLKENISRRVDMYGVSESIVQVSENKENLRLIVELPGIEETQEAIDLIGQTALLDFRRQIDEATPSAGFEPSGLTGADLKGAGVDFDPNTGQPEVTLQFTSQGKDKFAQITEEVSGQILAIFLDNVPLSFPRVQEPIRNGQAVIKGDFDLDQAKKLSAQLNAGVLPVSIKLVEQRTVEATLGDRAVKTSVRAGLIGLAAVAIFMIGYYGYWGFFAIASLLIYGLITFSLYRFIPVTLTLPGIAGFILSVGMAVDANILIFERLKEELAAGQAYAVARELAFGRAWDSIRDANVCTIIAVFILFNPFDWQFLPTAGMVRGFALTLGLGVLISLFTGIVVTRTLMRVFTKNK